MTDFKCQCSGRGHCPVFKRMMGEREFHICRGEGISQPIRDHYLSAWSGKPNAVKVVSRQQHIRTHKERDFRREQQHLEAFPCRHRGALLRTDESNLCGTRGQETSIYECKAGHKECSLWRYCTEQTVKTCQGCKQYETIPQSPVVVRSLRWAYGVTTVPSRKNTLLPQTLASLKEAGFDTPRLFVDGADSGYEGFGLEITYHQPAVLTVGNWLLALLELYTRHPQSERFALFQDDLLAVKNLKGYLNVSPYPEKGYLNLYTFPTNQGLAQGRLGWFEARQLGLGAVGLVFSREAVQQLLGNPHFVGKLQSEGRKRHTNLDGAISQAMTNVGWKEYCHSPSLVQHTGEKSTMGNTAHDKAPNFAVNVDPLTLVTPLP